MSSGQVFHNVTILSNDPNFGFSGKGWSRPQGTTCGENNNWVVSAIAGDTMSLHFIGATGLTLFGSSSSDHAKIHIQIDDVTQDLDLSAIDAGETNDCFPIFQISNLDDSQPHVLSALHSGPGVNTQNGTGQFAISHMIVQQKGTVRAPTGNPVQSSTNVGNPASTNTQSTPAVEPQQSRATVSAPSEATLAVGATSGNSKGGLITGAIFGALFGLLFILVGIFLARKRGMLCWKGRKENANQRISLSRGISSDKFFTGGISDQEFKGGISNTTRQFPFQRSPRAPVFKEASEPISKVKMSEEDFDQMILGKHSQDMVIPAGMRNGQPPSPSIIVEDYDSQRQIEIVPPTPNTTYTQSVKGAGPSQIAAANDLPPPRRRSRFSSFLGSSGSPTSSKFSIPSIPNSKRKSQDDSLRSGRVSPVNSVAPSWRTEDNRYSGVTVKLATREILRAEQPQFNLSFKNAGALEGGVNELAKS